MRKHWMWSFVKALENWNNNEMSFIFSIFIKGKVYRKWGNDITFTGKF